MSIETYLGTIAFILFLVLSGSTILIMLFMVAFGNLNGLTNIHPKERKWALLHINPIEYAEKCMPEEQRGKFIFLVKARKYSFYSLMFFVLISGIIIFIT